MTEVEWHTSCDIRAMLRAADKPLHSILPAAERTTRKRAFFAAACCRLVWPWVADESCRRAVEHLETLFDATIPDSEEEKIWSGVSQAVEYPADSTTRFQGLAANMVHDWRVPSAVFRYLDRGFKELGDPERVREVAEILRCIAGNPFRSPACAPSWRTSTVLALARGIYDERAFDRLPILADALQDAGCDDESLLSHCRGPEMHVRGCWAVDVCLGLE